MNIQKQICSNWSERGDYKPEIVVIHISTSTIASAKSWFNTPTSWASSHFITGKDGSIVQFVEEDKKAWANGRVNNPTFKLYKPNVNPNVYSLSIENEGTDLSIAPETQHKALTELLHYLCDKYAIPKDRDHIIGHYQIDGINRINCPSPKHSIMEKIVARLQPENTPNKQEIKQQIKNLIDLL